MVSDTPVVPGQDRVRRPVRTDLNIPPKPWLECRPHDMSVSTAGLNPNVNVSSMDMTGGLSVKDPSPSQSRLPQWTHSNPMDNLPGAASPLDQNPSKHGMLDMHRASGSEYLPT